MPNGSLRRAITAHLGPDVTDHGLTSTQAYRTASISTHRVRTPAWVWRARPADTPLTAIVFASEGALVVGNGAASRQSAVLLQSTHSASLRWTSGALATVVWLDTTSVVGSTPPAIAPPLVLPPTPLAKGLQAFAESLAIRADVHSRVSDYIVERLLFEMTHGLILEQHETDAQHQAMRPMHRARMLMLLNRTDADYGAPELARDLHISTRQLQRIFAAEGTSPTTELRRFRAELALSLLRDREYDSLTAEQIAANAGFTNAAAMRRGLHAIGAPTPQSARSRT